MRGGGARPGPWAAIRWGRCGLSPGREGWQACCWRCWAGREDAASGPVSGIPGAAVAQALRRARPPPLPPVSLGCGAGESRGGHSQPSGWPLSSTFWASVCPARGKKNPNHHYHLFGTS